MILDPIEHNHDIKMIKKLINYIYHLRLVKY
jgi:hypothetical protein